VGLHVVWCAKCRCRVLRGGWRRRAGDRVHLLVRVGSTDVPARVVRAFTGRTARVWRQEFGYPGRLATVWCSSSYFAASVGEVSESTVRRSIEYQWDEVA
jgi:putative transposase